MSLLLSGCVLPPKDAITIDVPFIPQEQRNRCGAIALEMSLLFFGTEYDREHLNEEAFVPALDGAPPELLASVAISYGHPARIRICSIADLRTALARQQVPIVYLRSTDETRVGHFAIVTGVASRGSKLRLHLPRKSNRWISKTELLHRSVDGQFPAVLLTRD
ncbi:MAG: hypothetical protein HN341_09055 [Verrucomicrobia bacterium]|nr:hypothetical protein [Verrucomicrobiota bacterium]